MAKQMARPLSPHLQIYRWSLTMALSILHRFTGVGLVIGLVLLTWWLTALARGPDAFAVVRLFTDNVLGGLLLFAFTFALFYHMANGIRHLVWDAGYGFDREVARQSGIVVLAVSLGLTLFTWLALAVI